MAEYKEIIYEKQRGGVLITLNRPEAMNAISRNLIKELHMQPSTKLKPIRKFAPWSSPARGAPFPPAWTKEKRLVAAGVTSTGPMVFRRDRVPRK